MANPKPYVSLACVCDRILQEKDGVMSAVRLVDTFYVTPPPLALVANPDLEGMVKHVVDVSALVGVRSGDVVGSHEVVVELVYPSGARKKLPPFPMTLQGGAHGHTLAIRLAVEVREYGQYWFDVLWEGETLTRIPFNVIRREQSAQPEMSSS